MNWKYNKLADEDNQASRLQATNRDAKPDTSRDRPLNRNKTMDRNLNENDISFNENNKEANFDEENTLKDFDRRNKLKSGNELENDN